jgi:hypothetical protein
MALFSWCRCFRRGRVKTLQKVVGGILNAENPAAQVFQLQKNY